MAVTYVLGIIIKATIGLRVDEPEEVTTGLNIAFDPVPYEV
jgi:hypothetical protein